MLRRVCFKKFLPGWKSTISCTDKCVVMIMLNRRLTALFIDRKFPWMGKHSGYDLLLDHLSKEVSLEVKRVSGNRCPSIPLFDNFFAAYVTKSRKSMNYDRNGCWSEISAAVIARWQKIDLIHVLYVESHFLKLPRFAPKGVELWATAHQPPSLWKSLRHDPGLLEGLDHLIVLSSESKRFFEDFLPGKVHFIPHGVDVEFFSPGSARLQQDTDFRCVFSGKWLRDLSVLEQTVAGVSRKNPHVKFDMIVPVSERDNEIFRQLTKYDNVFWHAGLSDEQLRAVYQGASLLLLPLIDCTANNALLEGVACGLPVVSNDVGGVRDYTDQSFAELLPVGDANGIVDAVLSLAENSEQLECRSAKARLFALDNLSWEMVARRTLDLYLRISSD